MLDNSYQSLLSLYQEMGKLITKGKEYKGTTEAFKVKIL